MLGRLIYFMDDFGFRCCPFNASGRHVLLVGAVEISPGQEEQRMKSSCDRFRLLFDVIKVRELVALSVMLLYIPT